MILKSYDYVHLVIIVKFDFMEFLKDIFLFIKERRKFWLLPMVLVLLILGLLIVVIGNTAAGPFIYTLF